MPERFLILEDHGPYKKGQVHTPKKKNLHVWRSRKWAQPVKAAEVETATREAPESAALEHVGGGWYRLPGGERVKGKQAALDALEAGD